jgi:hypothetical protein
MLIVCAWLQEIGQDLTEYKLVGFTPEVVLIRDLFFEHGSFDLRQALNTTLSRKEVIELADSGKMFLSEAALKVPHEGHERHLCELRKDMTREQYKSLIRNAQYFCQHCGRSAASSENLCFPEKN